MRTVVFGAGKSGVAAANLLASRGERVVITDAQPASAVALADSIDPRVECAFGEHPARLLDDTAEIVSPGGLHDHIGIAAGLEVGPETDRASRGTAKRLRKPVLVNPRVDQDLGPNAGDHVGEVRIGDRNGTAAFQHQGETFEVARALREDALEFAPAVEVCVGERHAPARMWRARFVMQGHAMAPAEKAERHRGAYVSRAADDDQCHRSFPLSQAERDRMQFTAA